MDLVSRPGVVWVLFFLAGLWSPAIAAETASKSGKAPAVEAKPKDPQAQRKNEEEVYQLQKLLVDTLDQVQRNYVKEVDRRKLVEAAIKGVLSELDPYSTYISPDELQQFESSVESEFGGIGITISTDDGQLRVLSPLAGTPAYRAGMIAGDAIVEIDGKSTADLSLDDAVKQLKGEVGSQRDAGRHSPRPERAENRHAHPRGGPRSHRAGRSPQRRTTPGTSSTTTPRRSVTSASPASAAIRARS